MRKEVQKGEEHIDRRTLETGLDVTQHCIFTPAASKVNTQSPWCHPVSVKREMRRGGPPPNSPKPNVSKWYIRDTNVIQVECWFFVTIFKNVLSIPLSSCKCDMLSFLNPICHILSIYYILVTFNFWHASINFECMVLLLILCSSVHPLWVSELQDQ